uniref:ZP domain-containing protein n=1 Tax=Strigamia maritima TaxID=126957 RepID=T1ILQ0_STRMM
MRTLMEVLLTFCFSWLLLLQVKSQDTTNQITSNFNPTVTATCQGKLMTITLTTRQPFNGIMHTKDKDKDYRTNPCSVLGNDHSKTVTLKLNILALPGDDDYCGEVSNEKKDDRKVAVAVRMHKTLELVDDKYFTISCNKHTFRNARSELSEVSLKFLDDGKRVTEVYHGRQYTLRAESSKPDGIHGIKVINCVGFSASNFSEISLIDSHGCPTSPLMSIFKYDQVKGYADATIFTMFKYPESRKVVIQCDIVKCSEGCPEESCQDVGSIRPQARTTVPNVGDDSNLMVSATANVLEPGETSPDAIPLTECNINRWSWLLGLCIAFGVLFIIMLIINIFLCSALTCTCTRQEVLEKDPSVIEEYDPYKGDWVGSQYGSRYSLNGKPGYTSGASTMNSTTRSVSTNSDHYAIVHSHPGSRYSTHGSTKGGVGSNGQYNQGYGGRM